ncbi:MAG TPA: sigma-70 family RNA polymerase sigma factor [Bacteroidales bacterium]|nr:sigma-70 family RNA polymerase sigma factor [Bacteroidales bacterium]
MKDTESWKELYERYAKRMLHVCMRYSPDKETAQDMMHDGFIQVFKSLDKFSDRGEGSVRAWMERIMINTCLQHIRKRDLLRESNTLTENLPITIDHSVDVAVERVPEEVLLRFLQELPVGYRTVFNLYVFEGLSHKDISKTLGIREKSSSSQFYRAKCLLAKQITEYERRQQ